MSYSFDGGSDRLRGVFTSSYAQPVTLAAFVKIATHPLSGHAFVNLGNNETSINDSVIIRTGLVDDTWRATAFDSTGTNANATATGLNLDGVWAGVVGTFTNSTRRDVYAQALANTDDNTTSNTAATALRHITVGETLAGGGDFLGNIAEVAIWSSVLSDADITSYLAGESAANISPSTLIGYWPLSTADLTNLGLDTGGDLAVLGGASFDADHPAITSGSDFTLTVEKADLQPSPKTFPLSQGMPFTAAATTLAAGTAAFAIGLAVETTQLEPSQEAIGLIWEQDDLRLSVEAATPPLVGIDVSGKYGIVVSHAVPTIAGSIVGFQFKGLTVDTVSPVLAPQDIILEQDRQFDEADFSLVGRTIALHKGTPVISASPVLTPADITLSLSTALTMDVQKADITFAGQDIGQQMTWVIPIDSAAFDIDGQNLEFMFVINDGVTVQEAVFDIDGQSIPLSQGLPIVSADPTIDGQSVIGNIGCVIDAAEFDIDGSELDLSNTFTLGIEVELSGFEITGHDVNAFVGSGTPTQILGYHRAWSAHGSFSAPIAVGDSISHQVEQV